MNTKYMLQVALGISAIFAGVAVGRIIGGKIWK
jgi:hypothetical protein